MVLTSFNCYIFVIHIYVRHKTKYQLSTRLGRNNESKKRDFVLVELIEHETFCFARDWLNFYLLLHSQQQLDIFRTRPLFSFWCLCSGFKVGGQVVNFLPRLTFKLMIFRLKRYNYLHFSSHKIYFSILWELLDRLLDISRKTGIWFQIRVKHKNV